MQDKLFGIDDDEGSSNFCQFLDVFKMVLQPSSSLSEWIVSSISIDETIGTSSIL